MNEYQKQQSTFDPILKPLPQQKAIPKLPQKTIPKPTTHTGVGAGLSKAASMVEAGVLRVDGKVISVQKLEEIAGPLPTRSWAVKDLKWILRLKSSPMDIQDNYDDIPIIIMTQGNKLTMVRGLDKLRRAVASGSDFVDAKFVPNWRIK